MGQVLGLIENENRLNGLIASASVPWIYNQQFWHALKLDDSKDKFKFFIDTKEFKFSVDDFQHVPTTQSQLIESTQGTHRTPSAPRLPNPVKHKVEKHLVDAEIEQIVKGNDDVDENQFDKEELQELTAFDPTPSSSKPTTSSPKPKSDRVKQYKSVFQKMSRRYGYMFRHLKQSFMQRKDFKAITETVHATLKKVVPSMVDKTLNNIMKKNLPKIAADRIRSERQNVHNDLATLVADAAKKEQESIRAELFSQVTHDVANTVPSQVTHDFEKLVPLVEPCRVATVRTHDHEDHDDDDARPEGESIAKRQRTSKHGMFKTSESSSSQAMNESTPFGLGTQKQLEDFDAWQDGQGTYDDDVPDEEVSPELLDEVSGKVMTSDELQRMQDALNDMLRNKCDSGEEHQYHLDQMQSYMES
ncbi:hypothetical protein Tco_0671191 [Tanacetum coccineum]